MRIAAPAIVGGLGVALCLSQSQAQVREFSGTLFETADEALFIPCGSPEGWKIVFPVGGKPEGFAYAANGPGRPAFLREIRVSGNAKARERHSSADFARYQLDVEAVLQSGEAKSICTGADRHTLYTGAGPIRSRLMGAAVTTDRDVVAILEHDGDINYWNTLNGGYMRRFKSGHSFQQTQGPDGRLFFNHNGTLVAEAGNDGYVRVFGVPDGELRWKLPHSVSDEMLRDSSGQERMLIGNGAVSTAAFTPDGELLVTAGASRGYVWSLRTGQVVRRLTGFGESGLLGPDRAVVASNPVRILTSGGDSTVRAYIPSASLPIFSVSTKAVRGDLFISPDNKTVAFLESQNSLALWSLDRGSIVHTLRVPRFMGTVAFSPDGRNIAVANTYGSIYIWNVQSGEPVKSLHLLPGPIINMWFTLDGNEIVTSVAFPKNLFVTRVFSPRESTH